MKLHLPRFVGAPLAGPYLLVFLGTFNAPSVPPTRSVSNPASPSASASGPSFNPVITRDGRFVLFTSAAPNLVTNDDRGLRLDLFLRDLDTETTELISVALPGNGGANDHVYEASLSGDGRYIAFSSAADNLTTNDLNRSSDIFLRDRATGATTLISTAHNSAEAALWEAGGNVDIRLTHSPVLSANGRKLVFVSSATNLVATLDANRSTDIYLHDLELKATTLVSVSGQTNSSARGASRSPAITPDGRWIAFISDAIDLGSTAAPGSADVYLHDTDTGATRWVSRGLPNHFSSAYTCRTVALSDDGQRITYDVASDDLAGTAALFAWDALANGTETLIATNAGASPPSLSADGRWVCYTAKSNVVVWNTATGSNTVLTAELGGDSTWASISADGTTVAFISSGSLPDPANTNGIYQLYRRRLAERRIELVSRSLDGTPGHADLDVTAPTLSGSGDRIAFESPGRTLVEHDLNLESDVFLADPASNRIRLLSARHSTAPAGTSPASATYHALAISADGRRVAFTSLDDSLDPADTNGVIDLLVSDLVTGNSQALNIGSPIINGGVGLIPHGPVFTGDGSVLGYVRSTSRGFEPGLLPPGLGWLVDLDNNETTEIALGSSLYVMDQFRISPDGRWVAMDVTVEFSSFEPPVLHYQDLTSEEGLLRIKSTATPSMHALFSPDSRWMVFETQGGFLTTNVNDNLRRTTHLYALDLLDAGQFRFLSLDGNGQNLLDHSANAHISGNSRYVAFELPDRAHVYLHDLLAPAGGDLINPLRNELLTDNGHRPQLNHDGSLLLYEGEDLSGIRALFLLDVATKGHHLVSVTPGGERPKADVTDGQLSVDDRFVVFASRADDLVENDHNGVSDVFVRDLRTDTTLLLSVNVSGTGSGNGPSEQPVLSRDGRTLVFRSLASDLLPNDFNHTTDIFVVRLNDGDDDDDGLDDDWEAAYFGNLDESAEGDFDQDGHSNAQELGAGTNPTDDTSILRVVTVQAIGSDSATVLWSAVPGRVYQVEYKDRLSALFWTELPGTIVAEAGTAAKVDTTVNSTEHRFYRVRVLPGS